MCLLIQRIGQSVFDWFMIFVALFSCISYKIIDVYSLTFAFCEELVLKAYKTAWGEEGEKVSIFILRIIIVWKHFACRAQNDTSLHI